MKIKSSLSGSHDPNVATARRPLGPFGRALLDWFDRVARDLPWRSNRDPYRVLVSEIMLQQTSVTVVLRYYKRFLERFPTLASLARASEEEVRAAWSGLGYYSRAKRLHQACRRVVERAGEDRPTLPTTSQELEELPGIGSYTAAAVASIAFGEVVPVLDGNVERVLTRLAAIEDNPKRAAVRRRLLDLARELISPARPGDSNQALMELGATVCRPRSPRCDHCPLEPACRARQLGIAETIPKAPKSRAAESVYWAQVFVLQGSDLLLERRSSEAPFLAGSWQLPTVEVEASLAETIQRGESPRVALSGIEAACQQHLGIVVAMRSHLGTVRHSVTHRRLRVDVLEAELREPVRGHQRLAFHELGTLSTLGTGTLLPKALELCGVRAPFDR